MPDTETNFAELRERCDKTIAYLESADRAAIDGAGAREVVLRFPNGMGYRFTGADYLTRFALPNFLFHATTAYAILRNQGVSVGKPDFLQHLGARSSFPRPDRSPAAAFNGILGSLLVSILLSALRPAPGSGRRYAAMASDG